GGAAGAVGLRVPISEESLLAAARKKTGLSDFGGEAFREPLRRLLEAAEREASLSAMGRIITRTRLLGQLVGRLRAEDLFKRHPEILKQRLAPPVFIVGLQRTGTTMLHRLLAADPAARFLASWEATNPAPDPAARSDAEDPRVAYARMGERGLRYLAPDFFAIHPVEALAPEEEVMLLDYAFLSTVPEATMRVPSFSAWLEAQDHTPAYEYLRRLLLLLQWQETGDRWALKTPHHMEHLETLLRVFPEARVLQTHRDPMTTLASFCSMIAHAWGIMSDRVDPLEVGRHWGAKIVRMLERSMEAREKADPARFLDVSYYDLMEDPMRETRRIYDFLGAPLTPEAEGAMAAWREENAQHKHGRHVYRAEDFGLDEAALEARFAPYRARFGVRREKRRS
ncbi:MAG: sulfotransferase, partial [Candidatus Methylomirabilis sp.]|nr:sulfotransferase [Deltaproteobacteria bacterium]